MKDKLLGLGLGFVVLVGVLAGALTFAVINSLTGTWTCVTTTTIAPPFTQATTTQTQTCRYE